MSESKLEKIGSEKALSTTSTPTTIKSLGDSQELENSIL